MIYEINLWLNPGQKYNGTLNINRGEQKINFSRLVQLESFIKQGINCGHIDPEAVAAIINTMDQSALYTWLNNSSDFVIWNPKNAYVELSNEAGQYKIPQNKTYHSRSKYAPAISFRSEV